MKKILITVLLLFGWGLSSIGQEVGIIWTSDETGKLYRYDINNCNNHFVCATSKDDFLDIAFTSDGRLWGITPDTLYRIDTLNGNIHAVGPLSGSNSLVGLNDSVLFMESEKKLYSVKTSNASSQLIGQIGYLADGDLTWLGKDLYMIGQGYLIKIVLNEYYTAIQSVDTIRNSANPYIYYTPGLTTAYLNNDNNYSLIAFPGGGMIYTLDTTDGSYQLICDSITEAIWGASSMVFPPTPSLSISQIQLSTFMNLYPNPATDMIHLSLHNFNAQPSQLSVQVFDYTGKMILQKKMEHQEDTIDISAYPAGIYLIKLRYKDKDVGTEKFVKQ